MAIRFAIALAGALGLVLAAIGVAVAQSGDAIPGGTYIGMTDGPCDGSIIQSGPDWELRLNDHGTEIISLTVNDLETPVGGFSSLQIPTSIRIGGDGSFDEEFDPLNFGLAIVHLEGRFEGDAVSGSYSVEAEGELQCMGTFEAQGSPPPERPPSLFLGSIDEVGDCGGGDIDITVSGDRLSVIEILVRNLSVHGAAISASATFDDGTVPIDEEGSFGWTYFPGEEPGQEIAVIGTTNFAFVSGALTVSPSECSAMPFEGVNPQDLGQGGTGAGSSGAAPLLPTALAAVGAVLFCAGRIALRRANR